MVRVSTLFLCFTISLILIIPLSNAGDTLMVEANIIGPTISIAVPDYLFLGNVTKGQELRSTGKVRVNNTGTVAIVVTPVLVNASEDVFNNLYFSLLAGGPYYKIGVFNFSISAPPSGTVTYEDFYLNLSLKNTTASFPAGVTARATNVRFVAVAQ